jgi:deoxyribonuclease-2
MGLLRWITSLFTLTVAASLQCKDDMGTAVDWWVAVKAPRGTEYFYGDSNGGSAFARSKHSMNDTGVGALGTTFRQIWSAAPPAYILWNDSPPAATGYNFSYGHTKGALALDPATATGFWLTHSVPLYPAGPALTPKYVGLGSNAWEYGQSAACFSLSATTMGTLAQTLQLNHPQIYDTGGDLAATPASFQALATGTWRADATCEQTNPVTLAGTPLTVFAKTPAWNADLWANCVAPALSSDLWVESWLRGSEEGPACNGQWHTLDVQSLSWGWVEHDDHSKWAVALNATAPTLCVGDINRMTTQYARAGGTVCWETPIAAAFISVISRADYC